jgi:hypothetical protein
MRFNRWSLRVAIFLAAGGSLPAALVTEADTFLQRPTFQFCHDSGQSTAYCRLESFDPSTGSSYSAEARAEASYGFLSVATHVTGSDFTDLAEAASLARFVDAVTVFGSTRIAYMEVIWDVSDLQCIGFCEIFSAQFTEGPVPGNVLDLYAELAAGDPERIILSISGSLRLTGIRVLDADMAEVTERLYYRSESGTAYNIIGASQVPEPGTAGMVVAAALLLMTPVRRPARVLRR